jgi:long-subunit fatty acid transport protein
MHAFVQDSKRTAAVMAAAVGLLALSAFAVLPAQAAADAQKPGVRTCVVSPGGVACSVGIVNANHAPTSAAAKPAPQASVRAGKARPGVNYEKDLWRHQGVG